MTTKFNERLEKAFEGGKILVVHHQYGIQYLDASTPEKMANACLVILAERCLPNYCFYEDDDEIPTDLLTKGLPSSLQRAKNILNLVKTDGLINAGKRAYTFLYNRSAQNYEYERIELITPEVVTLED